MCIIMKQAGAELCQAQSSQKLWLKLKSKLAVEVVIKVGVQPLFRVGGGGGWCSDEMK